MFDRTAAVKLCTVMLIFCLLLSGCSSAKQESLKKTFVESGLSITLDRGFTERYSSDSYACLASADISVFIFKENKSVFDDPGMSAEEYAGLLMEENSLELNTEDSGGILNFRYDKDTDDGSATCFSYIYESADAFWLVQFACDSKNADDFEPYIDQYAASVSTD